MIGVNLILPMSKENSSMPFSLKFHPLIVRNLNNVGVSITAIKFPCCRPSFHIYCHIVKVGKLYCFIIDIKTILITVSILPNTMSTIIICRNLRSMVHLCGNTPLMISILYRAFIHCHIGLHTIQSDRRLAAKFTFTCRRALRF